jgi:hypothetical protein
MYCSGYAASCLLLTRSVALSIDKERIRVSALLDSSITSEHPLSEGRTKGVLYAAAEKLHVVAISIPSINLYFYIHPFTWERITF